MIVPNMRALPFLIAAALLGQDLPDIDQLLKTADKAFRQADYPAARASLEQAWTAASTLPEADPKRYEVLKQLAGVLAASGANDDAEKYIEQAIEWRETQASPTDAVIAGDLITLSTICERRKDYDRAITVLERVVGIHTKIHGTFENTDVADDISRIALVQMTASKPEAAVPTLMTVIGIREKVLGADAPGLLGELDRLGAIQVEQRAYSDAEATFRRTLAIRESALGPESPELLTTLDGLSYSLFGEKKYDEAEVYYKRLLDLWLLVGNLPMIAETYEKMAVFYREQGKWEQGTEMASDAIGLRGLVYAVGLSTEATAWLAHSDKKHALELYKKALAVLDPNRKDHDGLRQQIERVMAGLEPPKKKPTVP